MPIYLYRRQKGGRLVEKVYPIRGRHPRRITCPDGVIAVRDMVAEARSQSAPCPANWPVLSNAMGCHPTQLAEMRRRFPRHEYAADGRMILRSARQRRACLKDLGMVDYQSYYD